MTDYFYDLLTVILDAGRELNPSRLSELSDPTREHIRAFRAAWSEAPNARRREISQHLNELARENIELLFERINRVLLEDPDPVVRKQAIENLWEAEGKDLALTLTRMVNEDPDLEVRRRAAEALSKFVYLCEMEKIPADVREHIEATLLELLEESPSRDLKRRALEALGYSSHIDLRKKIEASYDSGDEEDLRSSLMAMGRSADPEWRDKIEAQINHPAPRVRAEAARAIGEIQSRGSALLLIELLEDPKDQVRAAAIWSLGQVGGDMAREALEALGEGKAGDQDRDEIEQALEHIAFLDATPDLMMFDLSPEDE